MVRSYITYSIIICVFYLLFLVTNKKYKLLLPSSVHTFTWLVTSILMYLEITGYIGENIKDSEYNIVAEYICYMIIASVIGFHFAHIIKKTNINQHNNIPIEVIETILHRFRWILFVCVIVGLLQITFLISIGGFESFGDYRVLAVSIKRYGYAATAQRLSGHLSILGGFYLSILGYKQSITGINLKEFIKVAFCVALLNLAIGGRVWIINTTLPYITAYFYGMFKQITSEKNKRWKKDKHKIIVLITIVICSFSVIGMVRSTENVKSDNITKSFFNKFLYYTDGPQMANIVMSQYPNGTFPLEYGIAEFMQKWYPSPMTKKFAKSIEDDIALSVTVKSTIPYLYYDWGYTGGIFMWGLYAFILELMCISLIKKNSIFSLLLFVQLSILFFQAPIGSIFTLAIPIFEWLIIMYLLRNYIFKGIPNIKLYI